MIALFYPLIILALTVNYHYGMLFARLSVYHKGVLEHANYTRAETEARLIARSLSRLCRSRHANSYACRKGSGDSESERTGNLPGAGCIARAGVWSGYVFSRECCRKSETRAIEKPRISWQSCAAF